MKKILTAISLVLMLAACSKNDPVRDALLEKVSNLETVKGVSYDDSYSTNTTLSIYWDAEAAIKAGAASFNIVVSEEMFEYVDESGATSSLSFSVKVKDTPNDALLITKGIVAGTPYFVKVCAVYPGPAKSEWTYLLDDEGKPAQVIPGKGLI